MESTRLICLMWERGIITYNPRDMTKVSIVEIHFLTDVIVKMLSFDMIYYRNGYSTPEIAPPIMRRLNFWTSADAKILNFFQLLTGLRHQTLSSLHKAALDNAAFIGQVNEDVPTTLSGMPYIALVICYISTCYAIYPLGYACTLQDTPAVPL